MKKLLEGRRNFLKTVSTVVVAAAVPAAVAGQSRSEDSDEARTQGREQVMMIGYGRNTLLTGTYGRGSFAIQLNAQIGAGGYGSISDPVFPEANTHFRITSAKRVPAPDGSYKYEFIGVSTDSQTPSITGRVTSIAVDPVDPSGNCRARFTIESTPFQDVVFWIRNFSGDFGPLG